MDNDIFKNINIYDEETMRQITIIGNIYLQKLEEERLKKIYEESDWDNIWFFITPNGQQIRRDLKIKKLLEEDGNREDS